MNTPNNPPAFPSPDTVYPNGRILHGCSGMLLRDWFAGKAPPIPVCFPTERHTAFVGDAKNPKNKSSCPVGTPIGPAEKFTDAKRAAVWAYQYADAMLAERSREETHMPELHELCKSWLEEAKDDNGDPADVARSVIYAHCARELAAKLEKAIKASMNP